MEQFQTRRKKVSMGWSEADELFFIANLGAFSEAQDVPRSLLLIQYRDALLKRRDWNGIDRERVLREINMRIEHEQRSN